MPKEQVDAIKKDLKLEQTEVGKETVNGHPCVKYKITSKDGSGEVQNALVWKATDMEDFPVKMIITMPTGGEVTVVYDSVLLRKPDAALFNPPAGYTKFATQQELIQKAVTGAAKP